MKRPQFNLQHTYDFDADQTEDRKYLIREMLDYGIF